MATSLFDNGKVLTALPKAKELRGVAEQLISFSLRDTLRLARLTLRPLRLKTKV